MILSRLDHPDGQAVKIPGVGAAMVFLTRCDPEQLSVGRLEIDGQAMFALVARYQPRPIDKAAWESHRRYVDVQYIARGVERMGWTKLTSKLPVTQPYDAEKDVAFYDASGELVTVGPGQFIVFEPDDVHAPGLAPAGGPGDEVLKIVMKVRVPARA